MIVVLRCLVIILLDIIGSTFYVGNKIKIVTKVQK